jgi:hypothetical protein
MNGPVSVSDTLVTEPPVSFVTRNWLADLECEEARIVLLFGAEREQLAAVDNEELLFQEVRQADGVQVDEPLLNVLHRPVVRDGGVPCPLRVVRQVVVLRVARSRPADDGPDAAGVMMGPTLPV